MSDLTASSKIPKWRILIWCALGIGAFAWVAFDLGVPSVFWIGLVGIPIVIIMVLGIVRFARTQWALKYIGLLILIYVILQAALLVLLFLAKR